jgi:hypothetical protein
VSPVRYELGFYIPEDVVLHSHRRKNLKSYIFRARVLNVAHGSCSAWRHMPLPVLKYPGRECVPNSALAVGLLTRHHISVSVVRFYSSTF